MIKINPLIYFFVIILLTGCTENTRIAFFCEKDKKNDYIIKWEVFPERDNEKIDIFCSDNDTTFSKNPIKTASITDYIAILNPSPNVFREFFKLKVGKTYSGIITNRFFDTDKLQNLRDIGGHFTISGEQMKWGKIYRSGNLNKITEKDINILDSLGIKTIIDFRTNEQIQKYPDNYGNANYISIPIAVNCFNEEIKKRILEESFFKGDAIIYTQDCYRMIVEGYASQYAKMFDVLCDESNYPVLFHCGLGKDRTGIASYFILKALDILPEYIEKDYLFSNKGINKMLVMEEGKDLPETMQEAITIISTTDISQLKYAASCIKKKSGSVEEYLAKELKVDNYKKGILKNILLY